MSLRPYQSQALHDIHENWLAGITRQLIVMATGTGKTRVMAELPTLVGLRKTGKRALLLVQRDELCYQSVRQLEKYNPDLKVGLEKAEYRADDADLVVASIQTLSKGCSNEDGLWQHGDRLKQFNPDQFGLILVDETHHATSSTYLPLFQYFGVLKGETDCDDSKLFIGVTATPNRSDNIGLERLYDKITVNYPILDAVNDGWLCRPMCQRVETYVDISGVHTTAGDFNTGELSNSINTRVRNELIAREYLKNRPAGGSFFFTVDIQHASDLAETLRGNGIKVYPISGKTPPDECRRFMRLINEGAIEGLASAGKLTEGVDVPRVQSAQMCCPTKSQLRYTQMVGRVLRLFPSPEDLASMKAVGQTPEWTKPHAMVVDYVDVCGRHSLITTPKLFGLRGTFNARGGDVIEQAAEVEKLQAEHPGLDLSEETDLETIKAKLAKVKTSLLAMDLLAAPRTPEFLRKLSKFVWLQDGEGSYHLGLMSGDMVSVRENTLGQFEVFKHSKGLRTKLHNASNIGLAIQLAEAVIPQQDKSVMTATAAWRKEPLTEKQAWKLRSVSPQIQKEFRDSGSLYRFALSRFNSGDINYSRGSVSEKIDSLTSARR